MAAKNEPQAKAASDPAKPPLESEKVASRSPLDVEGLARDLFVKNWVAGVKSYSELHVAAQCFDAAREFAKAAARVREGQSPIEPIPAPTEAVTNQQSGEAAGE